MDLLPGGLLGRKMYTPARTVPQNPYPYCHKCFEPLLLLAQNFGQIHTLTGTKPNKNSTNTGKSISSLAHFWMSKTLPLVAHCLQTLPLAALKCAKKGPSPF